MDAVPWLQEFVWPAAIVLAGLGGGIVVWWLSRNRRTVVVRRVRERFLFGVPWGSIIVLSIVLLCYLVLQDGFTRWNDPLVYPFINWSYLYPLGVVLGPFAHGSPGHLLSNLTIAVVLAPLAEYIWGHYPRTPNRPRRRIDRPVVRAVIVFPMAVLIVSLVTSLFAWGPVIGFSGAVFAFVGFTVIRYPLGTIVAVSFASVLRVLGEAMTDPTVIAEPTTRTVLPGWVGVSFQGHAIGFLVGALVAIALIHRRPQPRGPDPRRLWIGLVIVTVSLSLWAVWLTLEPDTYILYRGAGVGMLLVVTVTLVLATVASETEVRFGVTRRHLAIAVVSVPLLVMCFVGVPLNALAVVDHDPPAASITVDDYDVYYDPAADNRLDSILLGDDTAPTTASGGVIVVSEERHLWVEAVSRSQLERDGSATVRVGGLGWSKDVTAERTTWRPVGNDSVYRVNLSATDSTTATYTSPARMAEPQIAGYQITVESTTEQFQLAVTDRTGSVERVSIPDTDTTATVGEVTLTRDGSNIVAATNDTSVTIASQR